MDDKKQENIKCQNCGCETFSTKYVHKTGYVRAEHLVMEKDGSVVIETWWNCTQCNDILRVKTSESKLPDSITFKFYPKKENRFIKFIKKHF